MSKTRGNVVAPWDVIDTHGADAFRWYYFTSQQPWDGYRFSLETVGETVRKFLLTLWNTYGFFVLYANVNGVDQGEREPSATDLDRWVLSRLAATTERVTSGWTTTTRPPPGARSPSSSTISRTGTCAARGGGSGTATRPAFADAARVPGHGRRSCSRRSRRSSPTRSTGTSTARSRRCTCATSPSPARSTSELEFDMAVARDAVELGRAARARPR